MIDLILDDCMNVMKKYDDNHFDLAIVDPPYGLGMDGNNNWSGSKHKIKNWDNKSPNKKYFNELIRISKNQIIWGANHFISKIPYDSSCWIVWDKKMMGFLLQMVKWLGHLLIKQLGFLDFIDQNKKEKEYTLHRNL